MAGPYLSVQEFKSAQTGIDWSSVPARGATVEAQNAEALRIIRRATSMVTRICEQKLWATSDVEVLDLPGRRAAWTPNGRIVVFTAQSPIIAVDRVRFSQDAQTWLTMNGFASIQHGAEQIPARFEYIVNSMQASQSFAYPCSSGDLEVTYRSGYPNAKITSAVNTGDMSLGIDDPMGILPGDTMTIYDDQQQEDIVIASSYTEGSSALPLSTPLEFAHEAGITVSEMAESIREATLLIATDLLRQRGRDTIAITSTGGTRVVQGETVSKLAQAKELLQDYTRRL